MSIIILDMDNCISNDEWRIPAIDWSAKNPIERYHDYHGLAAFDQPGNIDLFDGTKHDVMIFTARPRFYYAPTIEWLRRNGINPAAVFMRDNNDHDHSRELKRKFLVFMVNQMGVSPSSVHCAYDDRQDVVDMYDALGITAELRKIHDTCAYNAPSNIIVKH